MTVWGVTAIEHSLDKGRKKLQPTVNLLEISKSRDLTPLCLFLHFSEMQRTHQGPSSVLLQQPLSKAPVLVPCSPGRAAPTLLGAGAGLGTPGAPSRPRAGSLQRVTLALRAPTPPGWSRMKSKPPAQSSQEKPLQSKLSWNLCRTHGHLTSGTSANPPCVISMGGSCSTCTHTLFTGILQQRKVSTLPSQESPWCLWGFDGRGSTDPLSSHCEHACSHTTLLSTHYL